MDDEIRINLNKCIKVKLTKFGEDIYYHKYDELNASVGTEIVKPSYPIKDENGYTEFLLWDFMQLYGPHIRILGPDIIDPFEIVYSTRQAGEVDDCS